MVLVFIKNLLYPRSSPPRRPRDIESTTTSPLLSPDRHSYTCLESDFTTKSSTNTSPVRQLCPNPDCPRVRRPHSPNDGDVDSIELSSEKPWLDPRTVSDAIIGLSDGLTVPFALTAGLSAFNDTKVVMYGGFAELIAGSISMGLGGWLAGRGEAEFYNSTLQSTRHLVDQSPESIPDLIHNVFEPYQLPRSSIEPLASSLLCDPVSTVDFLMNFHHSLPPPSSKRTPLSSALTIAAGYFIGGFVPLLPYFFVGQQQVMLGLMWSIGVMAVCLFLFGIGRTMAVGEGKGVGWGEKVKGGLEMLSIGGVAAGASWGIVRALGEGS